MKHDDLWSFALACYAQPGVEEACLDLQSAGADVCLLLTCAWLECRAIAHDDTRLHQLQRFSEEWRTLVVAPLRRLRLAWREPAGEDADLAGLRVRVKSLELDAEHVQLQRLQSTTKDWPAEAGSVDWLGRACVGLGPETLASIETLRNAAASAHLAAGGD
ncbi:TIGR02444 family protein [Stutzerimonas stutzeri]|uniref:TIGR02444 family protein n=1 Tax=Stutzerimonas stutzeri TaxID=316 RepID=UPI00210AEB6F|nr:TIGR02444 family protein [Stutzerimonas stutzeri]MCQ4257354.1 TIGR02444 family protein [Stutzerimonas stutzeri]